MPRDRRNDGDPAAAIAQSAPQPQVAAASLSATRLKLSLAPKPGPNSIHHLIPPDSILNDEPHLQSADPIPHQSLEGFAQDDPKENLESKG